MPRDLIAAGDRTTAEAARELFWLGGNAFDVAVGGVFAAMVAEPTLTGPAGGGHLMAVPEDGKPLLFDLFAEMPRRPVKATELDFFEVTIDFGTTTQDFHIGRGSVATPGMIPGLLHVHERYGRLPRAEVLAPAIRCACEGVELSKFQGELIELLAPILTHDVAGRRLFAPGGELLEGGQLFKMPEFGAVLEGLARRGLAFYLDEVAVRLADWARDGGLLEYGDVRDYRVQVREPLQVEFKSATVLLNPPPAQSGQLIARSLNHLDENGHCGTPAEIVQALASAEELRVASQLGSTTHLSVMDRRGNAVAVTTTNGEGCGCIVPGLGFMPNNMLGEDDLNPKGFHRYRPGSRLASMVGPTVALRDKRPVLLTGSGGSKRIRSVIFQILVNVLVKEMTLEEATRAPRLHLEDGILHLEPGIEDPELDELARRYDVRRWGRLSLFFGGAHSVTETEAVGDPRRGGCGLVG